MGTVTATDALLGVADHVTKTPSQRVITHPNNAASRLDRKLIGVTSLPKNNVTLVHLKSERFRESVSYTYQTRKMLNRSFSLTKPLNISFQGTSNSDRQSATIVEVKKLFQATFGSSYPNVLKTLISQMNESSFNGEKVYVQSFELREVEIETYSYHQSFKIIEQGGHFKKAIAQNYLHKKIDTRREVRAYLIYRQWWENGNYPIINDYQITHNTQTQSAINTLLQGKLVDLSQSMIAPIRHARVLGKSLCIYQIYNALIQHIEKMSKSASGKVKQADEFDWSFQEYLGKANVLSNTGSVVTTTDAILTVGSQAPTISTATAGTTAGVIFFEAAPLILAAFGIALVIESMIPDPAAENGEKAKALYKKAAYQAISELNNVAAYLRALNESDVWNASATFKTQ